MPGSSQGAHERTPTQTGTVHEIWAPRPPRLVASFLGPWTVSGHPCLFDASSVFLEPCLFECSNGDWRPDAKSCATLLSRLGSRTQDARGCRGQHDNQQDGQVSSHAYVCTVCVQMCVRACVRACMFVRVCVHVCARVRASVSKSVGHACVLCFVVSCIHGGRVCMNTDCRLWQTETVAQ